MPVATFRPSHPLGSFFLLTFVWSWIIWFLVVFTKPEMVVGLPLILLGAFGPSFVGVALTYLFEGRPGARELWGRFYQISRVPVRWLLASVLLTPAIAVIGCFVDALLGGEPPPLANLSLPNPLTLLGLIVVMMLAGPLAEEFGWRGFALDRLQSRYSGIVASVILGLAWGLWHIPLFFIEVTSQHSMGFGTLLFWLFLTQVLSSSIIYTWVYNHTERSVLVAVLLHFVFNSTYGVLTAIGGELSRQTEVILATLWVLAAVLVLLRWGRNLGKRQAPSEETPLNSD